MIPLLRPPHFKAVIFDLFDTLVPSVRDDIWKRMAARLNAPDTLFHDLWRRDHKARSTGSLTFEESLMRFCVESGIAVTPDAVADLKVIRLDAVRETMAAPLETTVETLREIRARGFKMGLLSNCSEEVPSAWEESALAPLVDATAFSCLEGVAKPDALAYWRICERLDTSPAECAFIGDGNANELTGAASLGLTPIQILTSRPPQYVAHYHVARMEEVLTFLGNPVRERA